AFGGSIGHRRARERARDSTRPRVRAAEGAYGNCAGDNDRVADAAIRHYWWLVLSDYRSDYAGHLVLFDSAGVPIDHVTRGVRRLATRKDYLAGNGDHTTGRRSGRCKSRAERRCAYLYRGIHCCTGQFALVDVDPRPALIESLDIKMDYALALPARRISDLLSSGLQARVKSKRQAMDQPRSYPDQELVKRTQAGEASAFDDLVVKYTPRLYGLVYNMTSNHEDTNDLLQDIFAKAYKAIRGFRGKSSFYTWIHSIAVNMTLNFLKKR